MMFSLSSFVWATRKRTTPQPQAFWSLALLPCHFSEVVFSAFSPSQRPYDGACVVGSENLEKEEAPGFRSLWGVDGQV